MEAVGQANRQKCESGVAKLFSDTFALLFTEEEELDLAEQDGDDAYSVSVPPSMSGHVGNSMTLDRGLSSHSAKHRGTNEASKSAALRTTWTCFRSGWVMESVHTIFNYLDANASNDRQVARVLSNWTQVNQMGRNDGGRPPSLEGLRQTPGETAKGKAFGQALFAKYCTIEGAKDPELQELLTATVLMHLPKLVLLEHPKQRYGVTEDECFQNHRFLQLVLCSATYSLQVNTAEAIATLRHWSGLIEKDFAERNFLYAGQEQVQRILGHEAGDVFECDWRNVMGNFHSMGQCLASINSKQQELVMDMRSMHETFAEFKQVLRQQQIVIMEQNRQLSLYRSLAMPRAHPPPSASGLGSFLPPQQPAASASVQQSARQTGQESTAICTLPLPESPSGLKAKNFFVSWHANGYYVQPHDAYAKYTPGSKERKRVKSAVSRMRSVVEFFTLFLTEHVAPLPSTPLGSPSYTAWRKKLEDQADAAWCRFVRFWQEKKRVQRALPSEALSPFDSFMKTVSPERAISSFRQ